MEYYIFFNKTKNIQINFGIRINSDIRIRMITLDQFSEIKMILQNNLFFMPPTLKVR